MRKRIRFTSLSMMFILLMSVQVFAKDYSSDISSIMSNFVLNNYSCKSAIQQQVNGTYRTVEMLEVIAHELDYSNNYDKDISSIMSTFALNDYSCKSAEQQAVNGYYRSVELLEIIARETGTADDSDISSVMSTFALNDYSCKSAPQQQVNGSYRCVEMLEIIARALDTNGKNDSDITSVMSSFSLNNYSCESAPQQEVNGLYRSVEMLEIIAGICDDKGKYESDISSVMSDFVLNNYSCEGNSDQAVNDNGTETEAPGLYDDGLEEYNSGDYLYITNEDLDKYGKNMVGAKIYIVSKVDDMKDNLIQTTLHSGYMMSGFDVAENFDRYCESISKGDTVAILGTVADYKDYSIMGHCVQVSDCLVIAAGEDAEQYRKASSDAALSGYFVEEVEPQLFEVQNPVIYEGNGTIVQITEVKDGGSSFDIKVNIVNNSDLNLGFNARA